MQALGEKRRCRGGPLPLFPLATTTATSIATALLSLWATTNHFYTGHAFSSGIACPTEVFICLSNADCSACVDTLQGILASSEIGVGASEAGCEGLFSDVCRIVAEAGCDSTNEELADLASCVAEDTFGCAGFTSCADVVIDDAATPAPTTEVVGGTLTPDTVAPAPTMVEVAPDTGAPTPTMVDLTSVPTPSGSDGSRGADVFTAAPNLITPAPSKLSTPVPTTMVEPGEEASNTSGAGDWWRSVSTAGATVTRVSIIVVFFLAM